MFTNKESRYDLLLLDWGIGGLSVYREVKKRRPDLACLYVSDAGARPYGKMDAEELSGRLTSIVDRAAGRFGLRDVIIACNAASTAREPVARHLPHLKITGMIEAGLAAVKAAGVKKVGVIGGIRTVESEIYQKALKDRGTEVIARSAQPLSALIEEGCLAGPRLEIALEPILAPFAGIPALLLACTHYPAIGAEIQKILPGIKLLDPSPIAAAAADAVHAGNGASDAFYTTGDCAGSERAAHLAFGVEAKFLPADWLR
ncbi:MAG: hypothetical protein EOP11_00870 [Proteobacteria bacterium]|nr:MAG: hypothetical protein EOP11_00870 [Pseudomonadota bacterium]